MVEKQAGVGNVWSLETLRRWLAEKAGSSDVATLKEYVNVIPEASGRGASSRPIRTRSWCRAASRTSIRARSCRWSTSSITSLNTVRAKHPGYEIAVTGLSAIAARNSANMIEKLNRGLTIEFALVAVFIGLAFRSVVVMLVLHPAGHLPGGAVGHGAVVARARGCSSPASWRSTVSFGLGLSATIHFLNRLRLEDQAGRSVRNWRSSAPPCWSVRR